jgi:flagellar hook-basal body complex protein FliE
MSSFKVNPVSHISPLPALDKLSATTKVDGESFGSMLKSFVKDVNDLQMDSGEIEKKFLAGEITDIHQVMLAAEEASVAFELLMEIRNKLLDSYREIIRTPV